MTLLNVFVRIKDNKMTEYIVYFTLILFLHCNPCTMRYIMLYNITLPAVGCPCRPDLDLQTARWVDPHLRDRDRGVLI